MKIRPTLISLASIPIILYSVGCVDSSKPKPVQSSLVETVNAPCVPNEGLEAQLKAQGYKTRTGETSSSHDMVGNIKPGCYTKAYRTGESAMTYFSPKTGDKFGTLDLRSDASGWVWTSTNPKEPKRYYASIEPVAYLFKEKQLGAGTVVRDYAEGERPVFKVENGIPVLERNRTNADHVRATARMNGSYMSPDLILGEYLITFDEEREGASVLGRVVQRVNITAECLGSEKHDCRKTVEHWDLNTGKFSQ